MIYLKPLRKGKLNININYLFFFDFELLLKTCYSVILFTVSVWCALLCERGETRWFVMKQGLPSSSWNIMIKLCSRLKFSLVFVQLFWSTSSPHSPSLYPPPPPSCPAPGYHLCWGSCWRPLWCLCPGPWRPPACERCLSEESSQSDQSAH